MKTGLKIITLIFLFVRCGGSSTKTLSADSCPILKLRPVYFEKSCHGDNCSFGHTLMVENYHEECFSIYGNYDFVRLADLYLDSVKQKTPVGSVWFVKSFDFEPNYDSRDSEPLFEHMIADINYTEETWGKKVPAIGSVGVWSSGVRKGFDYLGVSTRQRGMDVYNEKKKAKPE